MVPIGQLLKDKLDITVDLDTLESIRKQVQHVYFELQLIYIFEFSDVELFALCEWPFFISVLRQAKVAWGDNIISDLQPTLTEIVKSVFGKMSTTFYHSVGHYLICQTGYSILAAD